MNKGVVVRTLAAFLLAAALLTVPSTAQAQSACDPGFTLTSGGVAEADLNGDGLTCEVTSIDSVTGGLITLALDNAPADQASTTFGCPDQHRVAPGRLDALPHEARLRIRLGRQRRPDQSAAPIVDHVTAGVARQRLTERAA